jgi:hypothetical protein
VDVFGSYAALSSDGRVALVGGETSSGLEFIRYANTGVGWKPSGPRLVVRYRAPNAALSSSGGAVALSGDAATALVGGPYESGGEGLARVFENAGS